MAVQAFLPGRLHREQALIWPPLNIALPPAAPCATLKRLASYAAALEQGAEGILFDVQISSRNGPVVADGLNRHARAFAAPVRSAGSGACRPRLAEILDWVRSKKCMAIVALNDFRPGAEIAVVEEIDRAKVRHLTRVVAPNLPGLQRLRNLDGSLNLGLTVNEEIPALGEAQRLGTEVLLTPWSLASPSFLRRAHGASMLVIPWTVNSLSQMRRTIMSGVDGIVTRYPQRFASTVSRLGKAAARALAKHPARGSSAESSSP